jgi:hypothetical protein
LHHSFIVSYTVFMQRNANSDLSRHFGNRTGFLL